MRSTMRPSLFGILILATAVGAFPGKRLFGKIKDDIAKKLREGKVRRQRKTESPSQHDIGEGVEETPPAEICESASELASKKYPHGALALIQDATKVYATEFGTSPVFAAQAPGRVNLIGEHTDYTGGFVLPLALEKRAVVVGTGAIVDVREPDSMCSILSVGTEGGVVSFDADPQFLGPGEPFWANYVKGVVAQYSAALPAGKKYSFKAVVATDVPQGAGLSSSASLEVSIATFLEAIPGTPVPSKEEKALRCQKAEHEYCNTPCGIMDQFISALAQNGALLQIDCRANVGTPVVMGAGDAVIVVTNSNVMHELSGSEYPTRVAQCEAATEAIAKYTGDSQLKQLRDASPAMLEAAAEAASTAGDHVLSTEGPIYRRAHHVLAENARVLEASAALQAGDFEALGKAMFKSHASLRDDFEVSCPELDTLVDLAARFDGVYGSRMTGGGFGGCIVTLVKESAAEGLITYLTEGYAEATGKTAVSFITRPGTGASQLRPL